MVDLAALGIDRATVARMYADWQAGASKSELERRYLGKGESHGKLFSALVRQELGIETERASPLSARFAELEAELTGCRDELHRCRAELARLRAENTELRARLSQVPGEGKEGR